MPDPTRADWPGARKQGRLASPPFQKLGHVKTMAGALAATGTLIGPAHVHRLIDRRGAKQIPMLWHKVVSRSLGVRSTLQGDPLDGGVLYVANHISWLDIPVLGAHLKGSFVAKSEVGGMGLVGHLANLQDTIYVERERRQQAGEQAGSIVARLKAHSNVILFPEGTSGDGVHVLPFKTSLFAVAEGEAMREVPIQPVTIAYTRLNGLPLTRQRLLDIAWIGDMEFAPHALDVMKLGRIEAHILCHAPVQPRDFPNRKALARYCHDVISQGYRKLMRGQD
ncbi:1-acyl-sn-glycerol-3-phosphate acyltransferase [Sandaracinobacter neustonicus]|uniref:1-acyl-sn-glycerol-3-phosphate acyltransferase n=1 Tax=Sandaracinobacter neustonicus TaxID=1715348 RepID=A0A501XTT0_9SPHN|nr:1-acyl-sn-glycerol-3-phosphate acyltransferase [Sandaracinobacter neustonicus]TPE63986.1 1-acyl-sn-glycerol-3-phosphate acyltransferase [Sandaracinobacter neustonicus]